MKNILFIVLVMILGVSEAARNCINGVITNDTCICFLGWMGEACDRCGGRIRLTNGSGVIADDVSGSHYSGNVQCLFLIETDRPASRVHLRPWLLHTECQWDYLHVFDGDSVFSRKLAAYTGDIREKIESATTNESLSLSDQALPGIVLSSTGSQILIYFYTDVAAEADGFEIDYWVDYACPGNCSGHGDCLDGICLCDTGWFGELCNRPVCPNNCSSNGKCNEASSMCSCFPGYTGEDCSADTGLPYWSRIAYSRLPDNLTLARLARASHSAVLWRDSMIIYGGYQFPLDGYSYFRPLELNTSHIISDDDAQVLSFVAGSWDVVMTSGSVSRNESIPLVPTPRYGHTAVVYNDTMYIFGGAKLFSEEIVNELWALDLQTQVWTPLFDHQPLNTELVNATLMEVGAVTSSISIESSGENVLPLAVRSHTAHVVGSKMIVLFGVSSGEETLISYIQEYDFNTGEWSAPPQRGFPVTGLMGHASAFDPETGLIYVDGGIIKDSVRYVVTTHLLEYDPVSHIWRNLTSSGSSHYLHSIVLFGPLLIVFGGCQGSTKGDCYTNEMTVYNIHCDSWNTVKYPGLPVNSTRYAHSAILHQENNSLLIFGGFFGNLHHDMLQLYFGNCSVHLSKSDCLMESAFCVWSNAERGSCVSVIEANSIDNTSYDCDIGSCHLIRNCQECSERVGCSWSTELFRCLASNLSSGDCSSTVNLCSGYQQCQSCVVHGCMWNGSHCSSQALVQERNMTVSRCPSSSCFQATSCAECTGGDCLWCPSLNHCVPSSIYPFYYIHGQCLGWVSRASNCSGDCSSYKTCSDCQNDPHCGWCNDESDTGLGECSEGGFSAPRNTSLCVGYSDEEMHERWFFEVCPACQCNGHSSCVNISICEACQNNTDGDNCEICEDGFWGDSRNGGICNECDCNGYNPVCDMNTGVCECLSLGVTGSYCQQCDAVSSGDANNFCFSEMNVNFIYTYSVDMEREQEGFFIVTPPQDIDLNFKFEITSNPNDRIIRLQLFVGRRSEDFWVLANLTDALTLESLGSYEQSIHGFTGNSNSSLARLHSFAQPSLMHLSNFTDIFNNAVENDYTSAMWDEDTTLVIYVYNLSSPMRFKITVDQQNLWFLLYFFITFITCFSILLTAFLLGWYIKQKIVVRNMLRQQYIELQRRVARPFARMKLQIEKLYKEQDDENQPQNASYISVETCRDNKAAILSLFIRLPGNQTTGRPVVGRSGLCVGSTMVKVNPSKKSKGNNKVKKRKSNGNSVAVETNSQSRPQNQNHSTSISV